MFFVAKRSFSRKIIVSSSVPKSRDGLEVVQECAVIIGRPVRSLRFEVEAVEISLCIFGSNFM